MQAPTGLIEAFNEFLDTRNASVGMVSGSFALHVPEECVCVGKQGWNDYRMIIRHMPTGTLWCKKWHGHDEDGWDDETDFFQVKEETVTTYMYVEV